MKIAIVTDSNSGITQKQAQELGVFVLAMPFQIDGETYYEDITLTQEEFYKKLREGGNISTSQPSPGSVTDLWDKILQEYDQIVHIPMSSGLSGSCQTAIMLAQEEEYEGKVYVVNNQRISVTQRQSVIDAKGMAEAGYDAAAIQKRLEETKFDSTIYITLDTLHYLKKGGRITPAAAALGTILRLKPVLQIQGEKLDAYSKARTYKIAKNTMLDAIAKDIEERFDGKSSAFFGFLFFLTRFLLSFFSMFFPLIIVIIIFYNIIIKCISYFLYYINRFTEIIFNHICKCPAFL